MISEICCNFKVLIYRITNKNRYDHRGQNYWNILYGRWLLQVFWCNDNKIYAKTYRKKNYHRNSTMSKAEVMLIMILFHDSGYRCFKHFYLEKVCKQLHHLFPQIISPKKPCINVQRTIDTQLSLFWIRRTHVFVCSKSGGWFAVVIYCAWKWWQNKFHQKSVFPSGLL